MILFSRSFIRKRVISLSTTATVAAASLVLSHDRTRAFHVHGVLPVPCVANGPDRSAPQPFRAANDAAINRMMLEMTVEPSGDADRDFVAMLAPHQQGAVDMANVELRYGHNDRLRQLAGQIVATREQEIGLMRRAVAEDASLPDTSPLQRCATVSSIKSGDATARRSINMN